MSARSGRAAAIPGHYLRGVRVRPAKPSEAAEISALAIASKAHWGYDEAAMEIFRAELTLREDELRTRCAHVLDDAGQLLGFYTLARSGLSPLELDPVSVELEHLYVRVGCFGRGLGSTLLRHAIQQAHADGARRICVQSDPNAEGFYARLGARLLERVATSVPGRTLPLLELILD